jgi:hypothetical protein
MIGGYSPWFLEEFSRRVDEESATRAMNLGQGFATSYDQYRELVGFIAGLDRARAIADEIKREQDAA